MNDSIDPHALPFRPCVGIVVFNRDGKVWIGRRTGAVELTGSEMLWQWPQGGIDENEDPLPAAKRELYEETGIHKISLLREHPQWLDYELPEHLIGIALKGRYRGQRQKWFAFLYEGEDSEIDIHSPPEGHTPEFDDWRWADLHEVPDLVVSFKRDIYHTIATAFADLSQSLLLTSPDLKKSEDSL
jgi:putative (di)nucleoside polyphosphate hydrolase